MIQFTKTLEKASLCIEENVPKVAFLYNGFAQLLVVTQMMIFKILTERGVPYFQVIYMRALLIVVTNYFIIKAQGGHCYPRDRFTSYMLLSRMVLQGTATMLVYYAVTLLVLSDAQTLHLTKPLWTIIFGIIFYGEKLSLLLCLSVLFFIAGILCVVRPAFIFGANIEPSNTGVTREMQIYAATTILISSMLLGISENIMRMLNKKTSSAVVTQYFTIAQLLTTPLLWVQDARYDTTYIAEPRNIALLLILTGLSYLGQMLISRSCLMESASKLAPLNYTRILYSFIFDIFIFHAQIETWSIIGNILILIGCYNVIQYT